MIKELVTMAMVATVTTSISNNFDRVMGAAKDITAIYAQAGTSQSPEAFLTNIKPQQDRLDIFGKQVASLTPQDLEKEVGPFGVIVEKTK